MTIFLLGLGRLIYVGTRNWHFKIEQHSGYYFIYRRYGILAKWQFLETHYDEDQAYRAMDSYDKLYNSDLYENNGN